VMHNGFCHDGAKPRHPSCQPWWNVAAMQR
jgi:hypothetical protein